MTKQEIVKQIARETGVEAATVLAVVEGFMEEVLVNVEAMPLTKNGKIDRKALMEGYNA